MYSIWVRGPINIEDGPGKSMFVERRVKQSLLLYIIFYVTAHALYYTVYTLYTDGGDAIELI